MLVKKLHGQLPIVQVFHCLKDLNLFNLKKWGDILVCCFQTRRRVQVHQVGLQSRRCWDVGWHLSFPHLTSVCWVHGDHSTRCGSVIWFIYHLVWWEMDTGPHWQYTGLLTGAHPGRTQETRQGLLSGHALWFRVWVGLKTSRPSMWW